MGNSWASTQGDLHHRWVVLNFKIFKERTKKKKPESNVKKLMRNCSVETCAKILNYYSSVAVFTFRFYFVQLCTVGQTFRSSRSITMLFSSEKAFYLSVRFHWKGMLSTAGRACAATWPGFGKTAGEANEIGLFVLWKQTNKQTLCTYDDQRSRIWDLRPVKITHSLRQHVVWLSYVFSVNTLVTQISPMWDKGFFLV